MSNQPAPPSTNGNADARAVLTDARRLFDAPGVELWASKHGRYSRACVVRTEDGPVDLLREKLFAHSPEDVDNNDVFLVFSDPHTGTLAAGMIQPPAGDLPPDVAHTVAGELERGWNIYPLLVHALSALRAYAGLRDGDGDDGVIEIRRADDVLRRICHEEHVSPSHPRNHLV